MQLTPWLATPEATDANSYSNDLLREVRASKELVFHRNKNNQMFEPTGPPSMHTTAYKMSKSSHCIASEDNCNDWQKEVNQKKGTNALYLYAE